MTPDEQAQTKIIAEAMAYGALRKGDGCSRKFARVLAKQESDAWVHEAYEFLRGRNDSST